MITSKIRFMIGLALIALSQGTQVLNDGFPDMIWEKPVFSLILCAVGLVLVGLSIRQGQEKE